MEKSVASRGSRVGRETETWHCVLCLGSSVWWTLGAGDGQGGLVCRAVHGVAESQTRLSDSTLRENSRLLGWGIGRSQVGKDLCEHRRGWAPSWNLPGAIKGFFFNTREWQELYFIKLNLTAVKGEYTGWGPGFIQSQEAACCVVPFKRSVQNCGWSRDRKCRSVVAGGGAKEGLVSDCFLLWGFFWGDVNILKLHSSEGQWTKRAVPSRCMLLHLEMWTRRGRGAASLWVSL